MRLVCSVSITNLNAVSQGFGGGRTNGARSTLSVFKKAEDTFLMWCTTKNKNGTKHKLKGNVEKLFTRMVSEGKATVRLKEPHIDLCISGANSSDLQRLLNALKVANTGECLLGKGVLSSSGPVQNKVIQKPKTKMTVASKQNYPVLEGFPSTLENLSVESCDLAKIDSRIIKLRHLTLLNLSSNKITSIPDSLASMQSLVELNMDNNFLTEFPEQLCSSKSRLCSNLRSLKLNHNQIKFLPQNFTNLSRLYQLYLRGNELKYLPSSIHKLSLLKILISSKNKIRILPCSLHRLRLDQLDVSDNDFMEVGSAIVTNRRNFFSLEEMAAKVVVAKKIKYDDDSLNHFCRRLIENRKSCRVCLRSCFDSYFRMSLPMDLGEISHTVVFDSQWKKMAPIDSILCSAKCLNTQLLQLSLPCPNLNNRPDCGFGYLLLNTDRSMFNFTAL